MTLWRHFLLVVCLLLAHLGASAHALEHALEDATVSPHVCVLCHAAQDLGAALPSAPLSLPQSSPERWLLPTAVQDVAHLRLLKPRQGAPPVV